MAYSVNYAPRPPQPTDLTIPVSITPLLALQSSVISYVRGQAKVITSALLFQSNQNQNE